MKSQYLAEQQIRQNGQTRASLKYLNGLSTVPRLPDQPNKGDFIFILYIEFNDFLFSNSK
jgi:hypothetical protein